MSDASSRHIAWRRLAVEGAVIVSSILLAFAIDAWWDGRQENARGDAYLGMLAADARETLRNNARFGAIADSVDGAGARLVRAYYEPEPAPRESIRQWFTRAVAWWVVQPALGTAQALVASGDLRLIRSDSVRAMLPRYLTEMGAFDGFEQLWTDVFVAAVDDLSRHVDIERLRLELLPRAVRDSLASADGLYPLPSGPVRSLQAVDVHALVLDPEVHRILLAMNSAKQRMRLQRTRMRDLSEQFLHLLEASGAR